MGIPNTGLWNGQAPEAQLEATAEEPRKNLPCGDRGRRPPAERGSGDATSLHATSHDGGAGRFGCSGGQTASGPVPRRFPGSRAPSVSKVPAKGSCQASQRRDTLSAGLGLQHQRD